ncbi:MAG: hypothetical protein UY70_C0003G0015 [Candidatus Kaiserbacteria bacterium GW2011_GWB1_52_6]|uniref:Uncharacterized protein n=3 Tax=Candidatus Kaiseribacteriota TaxID=1752734 RepID=A0A0G2AH89_9BACT|nr:MAG: hypothetical protein UY67_C0005G0027 [Candidatus Kaiserbacteria bacterium GW2011_GWA2_52_12]KKW28092.1 MAG: hypothetical protein UY70_C0003G0015 [Candidatus Kaiserbacteria bacterium GW2011_GWB1_52_6]KKW31929.1 MAG: hypothetical protein UY74_C0003G0002 [Candidatus Kaiserbacteria bacterium GW2011_GWC2_52_8b]
MRCLCGKRNDGLVAIILRNVILALHFAAYAPVHDAIVRCRAFEPRGLHHAATRLCPIARIFVHVLAPETLRAVIGVAGTLYELSTVLTGKVLDGSLEFLLSITLEHDYQSVPELRNC